MEMRTIFGTCLRYVQLKLLWNWRDTKLKLTKANELSVFTCASQSAFACWSRKEHMHCKTDMLLKYEGTDWYLSSQWSIFCRLVSGSVKTLDNGLN